jgi:hypothetical protein
MYTLFHSIGVRKALAAEMVPLGASLIAAEMFYRFHSFILECSAFLATWTVASALYSLARRRLFAARAARAAQ